MSKIPTAVEWLAEQFEESYSYINEIFKETIEQAKAMEKEQITAAYRVGKVEANLPPEKLTTGEQYYNKTYKGGEQ